MSKHTLKVTILGCASSGGVPRVGGDWGACDPNNPKNRRRRCSILMEQKLDETENSPLQAQSKDGEIAAGSPKKVRLKPTPIMTPNLQSVDVSGKDTLRVLVDTSPDLREQLLSADVSDIDAVLYTHDHADHCHGIDDLRVVAYNRQEQVNVYMADEAWNKIGTRFSYCFETPKNSQYPPILRRHQINAYSPFTLNPFTSAGEGGNEMTVMPLLQYHGSITSLAFRTGNFAYSTDLHEMPEQTAEQLEGLDVWIVDALRYTTHPSHFNVETALEWIERLKPKRAILTNLHTDLDYDELSRRLPNHVEPAFDGLSFVVK